MRNSHLHCRSELARETLKSAAFIQPIRVIVRDLREQARSYKPGLGVLFVDPSQRQAGLFPQPFLASPTQVIEQLVVELIGHRLVRHDPVFDL